MNRRQLLAGSAAAAAAAAAALPLLRTSALATGATSLAPILAATQPWLNGRATAASLAGRAVLVDVFTFGCSNCRNVTPNLRALHARRRDVAIIGVHTPETPAERDAANVPPALAELGVTWPVVLDPHGALWDAYGVSAWPTQLIFDRRGKLVATIVGDSQDAEVDAAVDRAARV